jgi:CheY-like chemotaxis protein
VVDDNADAGYSLGEVLETWGHEALVVTSAQAALDAWPSFRPDVALIDIGLPEIDGYELARRLQALHGVRTVQLIAVTGYGQAQDRQATREAGFHRHLTKPVDLEQLRSSLLASALLRPN